MCLVRFCGLRPADQSGASNVACFPSHGFVRRPRLEYRARERYYNLFGPHSVIRCRYGNGSDLLNAQAEPLRTKLICFNTASWIGLRAVERHRPMCSSTHNSAGGRYLRTTHVPHLQNRSFR
jgi:hypothetical protein